MDKWIADGIKIKK